MAGPKRPKIAAAFAHERDARNAVGLGRDLAEPVDYVMRRVTDERGATQMVVLEAECDEEPTCDKVATLMRGAHGVLVPIDPVPDAPHE